MYGLNYTRTELESALTVDGIYTVHYFEYIKDFESLIYSVDGTIVHNPTARTLWYFYNGEISSIAPGETKRV